jgi:hypothetical protein
MYVHFEIESKACALVIQKGKQSLRFAATGRERKYRESDEKT